MTKDITTTFTPKDNIKRISIREYIRNYKQYNSEVKLTNSSIIITNQENDEVILSPIINTNQKRKWTVDDFKDCFFKGDKNLSKNIDKIVYGI